MSFDNRTNLSKGPNLADILLYLLSKWPWYVLALVLCLAFSWYRSATAPLVYYAQSKVIIKDPSNKTSTGGLDRYDNSINRVNVTNEILQLRSKRLLQEVVARTRADVSYTTRRGLRDVNIYGVSPVEVTLLGRTLQRLLDMVIENPSLNTRETLLKIVMNCTPEFK